jgi:hypothetical protein
LLKTQDIFWHQSQKQVQSSTFKVQGFFNQQSTIQKAGSGVHGSTFKVFSIDNFTPFNLFCCLTGAATGICYPLFVIGYSAIGMHLIKRRISSPPTPLMRQPFQEYSLFAP